MEATSVESRSLNCSRQSIFAAHVAHARYAVRHQHRKRRRARLGEVRVHVPEPRDDERPADVHASRPARETGIGSRVDGDDAATLDEHHGVGQRRTAIEEYNGRPFESDHVARQR
jgi:hypothetical protein